MSVGHSKISIHTPELIIVAAADAPAKLFALS